MSIETWWDWRFCRHLVAGCEVGARKSVGLPPPSRGHHLGNRRRRFTKNLLTVEFVANIMLAARARLQRIRHLLCVLEALDEVGGVLPAHVPATTGGWRGGRKNNARAERERASARDRERDPIKIRRRA